MFVITILLLLFGLSPSIIGDLTTIDSHIQTNVNEESITDPALSFGIKSFTVEVTKPTTTPINTSKSILSDEFNDRSPSINIENYGTTQQSTTHYLSTTTMRTSTLPGQPHTPDLQQQQQQQSLSTENLPTFATFMPFLTMSSSLQTMNSNDNDNHVTILQNTTEMRTESEIEQESTDERPPAFSTIFPAITSTTINSSQDTTIIPTKNTVSTTHEPMINDIHIEKKLENGLYRIKLAEIITDEFNGIGNNNDDTMASRSVSSSHESNNNFHQTQSKTSKINIIDLYPSKLEDFGPIIRDSNNKMIHDKQTFLNNDDENVLSNSLNDLFENEKNIPTSKIEIELIDGNENNHRKNKEKLDKITDLTGKLQEQDGVITEIEKKFRLDDLKPQPHKEVTPKPLSINQKIEFIDRRVKKSFDFPQNQYGGRFSRIDFANTKFNTEPVKKDEKNSHFRQGDKPEFSTTKFYNSKELYNEMLHRKINSEVIVKKLTTTSAPVTLTDNEDNVKKSEVKEPEVNKESTLDSLSRTTISTTRTTATTTTAAASAQKLNTKATNTNLTQQIKTTAFTTPRTITKPKIMPSLKPSIKTKKYITTHSSGATSQKYTYITSSSSVPPLGTSVETLGTNKKSMNNGEQEMIQQSPKLKLLKVTSADGTMSTTTVMPVAKDTSTITISTAAVIMENVNPTLSSSTTLKTDDGAESTTPKIKKPFSRPRVLTRLQEKINSLECDIQNLPQDSHLWRGNETHELFLPITTPADCKTNEDCLPMIISWEGQAEIQSGDVLLVEINDSFLIPTDYNQTQNNVAHKTTTTVYQVTRPGHEHCDVTEGVLLDITPLVVDGKKIVTLYDKDLSEGVNFLIVVSESWGSQCVRLKVTVKSDNCGENTDCSGKGVCFSNASMEGYECQCCQGFAGPHCEEIDACLPSPCTNNGICVDLSQGHEGNAYQCLCPYGYTGKNCQYESDPCNPAQCLNGGSCVGNSTHFRCDCAPGYAGQLCQHNLNECESSPCVHGICVDQEDGFRCFCQPGFAGELCNFEYNECESNPCMNGGQCIDQIGGYECKCTRGYTGNQCHVKVDFCANGPCPEGHRCIDRGDDFTCECPSGTNGPDCIQVPRTLCNVNPCSNGGTCWTSEDSFYCACRPGYTGKMCEDEFIVETVVSSSEFMVDDANARSSYTDKAFGVSVSKSPIELHNAYIAAGTLAAAIFIVAVVVTICHCKVNQTYRRFSTRHHQLIPIFGFGRRMKSPKSHRHWLSGKGGGSGGGGSTSNLVGIKSNKGHLPGTGTTTQCHNHHIGSTPSYHNSHQLPDRPFQRHLAMNLENDMYYTVDFSDSQHSPLIK